MKEEIEELKAANEQKTLRIEELEAEVDKLSILSKQELVAICQRNQISVTGEKRALAARILRKLGPLFGDESTS